MSNEHGHISTDPELSAVAAALGSLTPSRSRLDRDRVMFRAGQASAAAARRADPVRRFWPAIAASLGLIAAGEAAWLACRPVPSPRVVERVVVIREPAAPPASRPAVRDAVEPAPAPPAAVLAGVDLALGRTPRERLAGQVLRYGLDGLPASPPARWTGPASWTVPSHQLLVEELQKTLSQGDPS